MPLEIVSKILAILDDADDLRSVSYLFPLIDRDEYWQQRLANDFPSLSRIDALDLLFADDWGFDSRIGDLALITKEYTELRELQFYFGGLGQKIARYCSALKRYRSGLLKINNKILIRESLYIRYPRNYREMFMAKNEAEVKLLKNYDDCYRSHNDSYEYGLLFILSDHGYRISFRRLSEYSNDIYEVELLRSAEEIPQQLLTELSSQLSEDDD